jgi:hypothetical protein
MTMAGQDGAGISKAATKVASKILNKHGNPFESWQEIQEGKEAEYDDGAIAQRVHIPVKLIEAAVLFWKNIYLETTVEDGGMERHLNGKEAYKLGTEEGAREMGMRQDQAPYIGMCNLMALEAMRMMGDQMPTTIDSANLAFADEREREICEFWHETFAPTAFQAEWAWKAALSVMAGEPHSTEEMLGNFKAQLP